MTPFSFPESFLLAPAALSGTGTSPPGRRRRRRRRLLIGRLRTQALTRRLMLGPVGSLVFSATVLDDVTSGARLDARRDV